MSLYTLRTSQLTPLSPHLQPPPIPLHSTDIEGLYCVGDSTFPGQGVNAVVFSGFGCAHRALCDLGVEPTWPAADKAFRSLLNTVRNNS